MYEMNLCERSYSAYKVGKDVNVCMYVCMSTFPSSARACKESFMRSFAIFKRSISGTVSFALLNKIVCMYACTCMYVFLCNQIYSLTWFGIFFHLPHIQLRIRCGRDGHLRGPPRAACASPRPARHHSTYGSAEPER